MTIIAPTAGAALLTLGSWRLIYAIQAVAGIALPLAVLLGFDESAKIDPANRLTLSAAARCYLRILTHRVSFAYILVGAAGGATAGCIQIIAGTVSSALVALLFDGRSALAMVAAMAGFSLMALISYGCSRVPPNVACISQTGS